MKALSQTPRSEKQIPPRTLRGEDGADVHPMRIRVETAEGVLVVYDSADPFAVDPDGKPECSGFLAYYLSIEDATVYVFGGVLEAQADLAEVLLALQRDLGVDLDALSVSDERLEAMLIEGLPTGTPSEGAERGEARRGSRRDKARNSDRNAPAWERATLGRAVEIMGFDPANLPEEDETSGGGVAVPVEDPCASLPEPPKRCGSPIGVITQALEFVVACGGGGGGGGPVTTDCHACASDGNPCTYDGWCNSSAAYAHCYAAVPNGAACTSDGKLCTDDVCSGGTCTHPTNTGPCNDNNACTTNDACSGGNCVGGPPPNCDDDNSCTIDSCNPASGCEYANNPVSCQDDGDDCTDDRCNGGWCTHWWNTAPCDDGNACTTNDACLFGDCVGGAALVCNDNKVCTSNACNPATGCVFVNNTVPCDDGLHCTVDDHCLDGTCSGDLMNCDDNNACTQNDRCVAGVCVRDALDCDDGNLCSLEMGCDPVLGCVRRWKSCGDDNPCTTDECNTSTGSCVHVGVEGSCDDSDPCTSGDACTAGNCAGTFDAGCQCPFDYRVDGEGAGEGMRHERTTHVPIAMGTNCVWVRAEYFTREFPTYTSQPSIYNDQVSFSVRYPGGTAVSESAVVNDLNALFAAGGRPGGTAVLDFSTLAQYAPSWIETTGAATNVGDGIYGSGVRFRIICNPAEMNPVTSGIDPKPLNPAVVAPVDVLLDNGQMFVDGNLFGLTKLEPNIDLSQLPVEWSFVLTEGSITTGQTVVVSADRRTAQLHLPTGSLSNFGAGRMNCCIEGDDCASVGTLVRNVQPDLEAGDFRFKVKAHLCTDGAGTSTTRTAFEVRALMADVTKVLSQCGIIVTMSQVVTTVVPKLLFDDLATSTEMDDLFAYDPDDADIDMYFVIAINGGNTAGITLPPTPSLFDEAGVAIADIVGGAPGLPIAGQEAVRTIAHELSHYLLNYWTANHRPEQANLMFDDVLDTKRDLDEGQCLEMRSNYGVD